MVPESITCYFCKSVDHVRTFQYLYSTNRKFYSKKFEKIISEHRSEFVTLTFLDELRLYWTDEELRNFLFNSDKVLNIVYYVLSNNNDFCMLFRMNYKSRPLYVEIIYINNACETRQMSKLRGWKRFKMCALQSSIIVTYSVQRFLDHIVSNYDHKDIYSCNWRNETWEVEDRDFIYENILVCRAIEGGNIDAIKRSWSHLSSLQQLCRGVVSANRETLWNDSTQMDIPVFVGREIQEYIFTKDRRERKLLNGSFTCKTFISI